MLLKLGGSVITFKDKPLTPNVDAIVSIVKVIKDLDIPCILVHGGGSFGHYWSVEYDVHTKPDTYNPKGISVIHDSMIHLNKIIVDIMIKENLNPYSIMPDQLTSNHEPLKEKISLMLDMSFHNIIPVTFGDVVYIGNGLYSILSGDELMTILSKQIEPERIIFATNVDGIFSDMGKKVLLKNLFVNDDFLIDYSNNQLDVTGGMQRKVNEAIKIASTGLKVRVINGLFPNRLIDIVKDLPFIGTTIEIRR